MKKALAIVFLLAAIGAIASLWLIPGQPELALINYKDKKFAEAKAAYEKELESGRFTPEVINTLIELNLQDGDIDQAISVMEQYVARNPNDIGARQRLGQLYQYAQRGDDYLRNLEEINRIAPSTESLSELSNIYNARRDYERQADSLKQLIALEKETNPQHYKDLANILAVTQSRQGAIDALLALKEKHPEAMAFKEAELLISLLLDEKRPDDALTVATGWREKEPAPPPAEVARLVNLLHYKASPELAEKLMESYDDAAINASSALLQEKILLLLSAGREPEAYERLKALQAKNALSPEMKNRLLFLAIARGDEKLAESLISSLDMKSLNEFEALSLLDLAVDRHDTKLRDRLAETFDVPEYRTTYPLLAALISTAKNASDAPARLKALDEVQLSTGQLITGARICLRLRNNACSERFIGRLPPLAQLSDAEAVSLAGLYLDLRAYEKGRAIVEALRKTRNSPQIEELCARFAAVTGDFKPVEEWLAANGKTASLRTLTDLFFAARNHKHHALAAKIALQMYAREQNAHTRHLLATSYVDGGEYAKAVALLRESKQLSADDESNYLLALTKLAKTSPEYRRELGAFAGARLKAGLPYERKMQLIYALINAGQVDVAMPYIRELALKNGGQWAWLYATQLTRQGRHEEAREFWIALANQPGTSDAQREAIAYNLLAGGDRAFALAIFQKQAAGAPVDSRAVRQLLYLWGPRLNAERLDWLAARYASAPATERAAWAEAIAARAGDEEIVSFTAQRHPQMLYEPAILRAYVGALARSGELKNAHTQLFGSLREHGGPGLIRIYAQTARAYGYRRPARDAYEALFALNPADNEAPRELGLLAYGQADYAAARMYLTEYFKAANADDTADHIVPALYYYGDLLERERDKESANAYYAKAVAIADAAQLQTPEALSQKAQSLIRLGRVDEGLALFQQAMQAYPDNDLMRADYASALVELKRYDEARALLDEPMQRLSGPGEAPQSMPVPMCSPGACDANAKASEVVLHFAGNEEDLRQFATNIQTLPWVSYTSEGYRELLVVAKPGYALRVDKDAQGTQALVPIPVANDEARRQTLLRYQLLAARIDLEQGRVYAATSRLNALLPQYPDDAQLMGFAANAENYGGNWQRAQALLSVARTLAPENEDIALLHRDIRRSHAPNVKADYEWVKRGNGDREHIMTLSGHANATEDLIVGFVAQDNHVRTSQLGVIVVGGNSPTPRFLPEREKVRRADRKRGELYAQYLLDNGDRVKASLFANDDTLGGGLYYEFLNPLGETGIGAEYHRPYWDFYSEAVLNNTTRDRLSLWHTIKPTPQWSVRIEPGINRYNMDDLHVGDDRAGNIKSQADSWTLDGRVVYRPVEDMPYMYLSYGLSAEYFRSNDTKFTFNGAPQKFLLPVPFRNREIHFVSVNSGYQFAPNLYADGLLGYGYDRHGGNGPMAEGRLTYEVTEQLDAQIRASFGFSPGEGDNETHLGGYVRWKF